MKGSLTVIVLLCAVACSYAGLTDLLYRNEFASWISKHQRNYSTLQEHEQRLINFVRNYDLVEAHKVGTHSYTVALNNFADFSYEEFAVRNGFRAGTREEMPPTSPTQKRSSQPSALDWQTRGAVTPVKDQGQCGSCYAFSVAALLESANYLAGRPLQNFSAQNAMDCQGNGCDGGTPQLAIYAMTTQGIELEVDYPYVGRQQACAYNPSLQAGYTTNYVAIQNNEQAFLAALQTAPIAVTVCADTWSNYQGGIFTNCQPGCDVNHAVLLVGYGTDVNGQDFWRIKNSWNTWWGESGYIRLPRTNSGTSHVGVCGLATYAGFQANSPGLTVGSTSSTLAITSSTSTSSLKSTSAVKTSSTSTLQSTTSTLKTSSTSTLQSTTSASFTSLQSTSSTSLQTTSSTATTFGQSTYMAAVTAHIASTTQQKAAMMGFMR